MERDLDVRLEAVRIELHNARSTVQHIDKLKQEALMPDSGVALSAGAYDSVKVLWLKRVDNLLVEENMLALKKACRDAALVL